MAGLIRGSRSFIVFFAATAAFVLVGAAMSTADAQATGSVLIRVKAGGQEAKAQVVVTTAEVEPREVAKGRSGTPISLPAGRYDVNVTCLDLLDHPTQTLRDMQISGGNTVERDVSFPAGTVTLHVKRGSRPVRNAALVLKKAGSSEPLPEEGRTETPLKLSPGSYEAEIVVGRKNKHSITGIQVYDGAVRHIPVSL